MGHQLKGLLYFFMTDNRYTLTVFWTILISLLVVSIGLAYFLINGPEDYMFFELSSATYVFCAIIGFLTVKASVPFLIKIGATRKKLFISTGIFFFSLSFLMAVFTNTLHSIALMITEKAGIQSFGINHLSQLIHDNWFNRVIIDISILFFLLSIAYMLGLLFYRYGLIGGGFILGLLVLGLIIGVTKGWLIEFFIELYLRINMGLFFEVLLVGLVIYCLTFIFIRRITIVDTK